MQAFEDGKKIEYQEIGSNDNWLTANNPTWSWVVNNYRIKPKEQPEEFDNELLDKTETNFFYHLLKLAKKFNKGWEPDWNNEDQSKFFLTLREGELYIYETVVTDYLTPCFKSEKAARKAIKKLEKLY